RDVSAVRTLAAHDLDRSRRNRREMRGGERIDEEDCELSLPEESVPLGNRQRCKQGGLDGIEIGGQQVRDLDEVDPIQRRRLLQRGATATVAAEEHGSGHRSYLASVATRVSPVRRTT